MQASCKAVAEPVDACLVGVASPRRICRLLVGVFVSTQLATAAYACYGVSRTLMLGQDQPASAAIDGGRSSQASCGPWSDAAGRRGCCAARRTSSKACSPTTTCSATRFRPGWVSGPTMHAMSRARSSRTSPCGWRFARPRAASAWRAWLGLAVAAGLFATVPTFLRRTRGPQSSGPDLSVNSRPREMPSLRFSDGQGTPTSLAAFHGRVVLLNGSALMRAGRRWRGSH